MISACCWLTRRLIPKVLKTSDACSQPELWHSCSSSSVDPLQWTQPGPSRWWRFLTHKSNYSATAGEKKLPVANLATPSLLVLRPCHFLSYIREMNCKHTTGIFFKLLFESLCRCSTSLKSYCWLCHLPKDASFHLCSITKTETLLRFGWKIFKQMRLMNPWKRLVYFYSTTDNGLKV